MGVEDELGAIMRSHDRDAPQVADLPPRPWHRWHRGVTSGHRRLVLPLAAAAAVVLLGAGVVAFGHGESSPSASGPAASGSSAPSALARALPCPAGHAGQGAPSAKDYGTVPSAPRGVDTHGHLVPDATPESAVVCAYDIASPPGNTTRLTSGSRQLGGDLDAVRDQLYWVPPAPAVEFACTAQAAVTDAGNLLVGLTYRGGGVVWVAAPANHCAGSSNGVVRTGVNLSADATAALRGGRWPTRPTAGGGRYGQQDALVPPGATSAVIERSTVPTSSPPTRSPVVGGDLAELVRALDLLNTRPSAHECIGGSATAYVVWFAYSTGPPANVTVDPGCRPELDNGSLQSAGSTAVDDLVDRLTR